MTSQYLLAIFFTCSPHSFFFFPEFQRKPAAVCFWKAVVPFVVFSFFVPLSYRPLLCLRLLFVSFFRSYPPLLSLIPCFCFPLPLLSLSLILSQGFFSVSHSFSSVHGYLPSPFTRPKQTAPKWLNSSQEIKNNWARGRIAIRRFV